MCGRIRVSESSPERVMHKAVRKTTGSKESQPRREAMWATTGKTTGQATQDLWS